jgi:hypothetical protein
MDRRVKPGGDDGEGMSVCNSIVMAARVAAIHVLAYAQAFKDVDARHKVYTRAGQRPDPCAGHDGEQT